MSYVCTSKLGKFLLENIIVEKNLPSEHLDLSIKDHPICTSILREILPCLHLNLLEKLSRLQFDYLRQVWGFEPLIKWLLLKLVMNICGLWYVLLSKHRNFTRRKFAQARLGYIAKKLVSVCSKHGNSKMKRYCEKILMLALKICVKIVKAETSFARSKVWS